jgi:hypothetical protein
MKIITYISTLLTVLASLPCHSKNIGFADADYCINWIGNRKVLGANLVFVKENNNSNISLITKLPGMCRADYRAFTSSYFYFIDRSGREVFSFESLSEGIALGWNKFPILSDWEKEIPLDFPDTTGYMETSLKNFKKNDLLRLKGKIIGAYIKHSIQCPPEFDTTYRIDFSVRIIGECKRETLKNK